MYFVSDGPILFSTETEHVFTVDKSGPAWAVFLNNEYNLFSGELGECADFIYSIAGRLDAVNPERVETPAETETWYQKVTGGQSLKGASDG